MKIKFDYNSYFSNLNKSFVLIFLFFLLITQNVSSISLLNKNFKCKCSFKVSIDSIKQLWVDDVIEINLDSFLCDKRGEDICSDYCRKQFSPNNKNVINTFFIPKGYSIPITEIICGRLAGENVFQSFISLYSSLYCQTTVFLLNSLQQKYTNTGNYLSKSLTCKNGHFFDENYIQPNDNNLLYTNHNNDQYNKNKYFTKKPSVGEILKPNVYNNFNKPYNQYNDLNENILGMKNPDNINKNFFENERKNLKYPNLNNPENSINSLIPNSNFVYPNTLNSSLINSNLVNPNLVNPNLINPNYLNPSLTNSNTLIPNLIKPNINYPNSDIPISNVPNLINPNINNLNPNKLIQNLDYNRNQNTNENQIPSNSNSQIKNDYQNTLNPNSYNPNNQNRDEYTNTLTPNNQNRNEYTNTITPNNQNRIEYPNTITPNNQNRVEYPNILKRNDYSNTLIPNNQNTNNYPNTLNPNNQNTNNYPNTLNPNNLNTNNYPNTLNPNNQNQQNYNLAATPKYTSQNNNYQNPSSYKPNYNPDTNGYDNLLTSNIPQNFN